MLNMTKNKLSLFKKVKFTFRIASKYSIRSMRQCLIVDSSSQYLSFTAADSSSYENLNNKQTKQGKFQRPSIFTLCFRLFSSNSCKQGARVAQRWVEFVVSFLICSGRFSPCIQVLASSQKPTVTNSNSTRNGRQRAAQQICYFKSLLLILLFAHAD